ncbi:MAG: 1-acyl-sn-glycerol-3-phosphate acyltransferase [Oscillospiraceae bacterium]|jgi:1-acyl-sn-glycerol-3-phosphate acyltransferase|nr:1-acyl-sn-glycerol-3-phosphate acyltransferase [Oscillospiraceae bacterium]
MKPFDYTKLNIDPFYRRFGKPASRLLPLFYKPLCVSGVENIPPGGAVIIACNHLNARDPVPIMAAAFGRREIHFMAKAELFENPFAAYFFRRMGGFPVKRGLGARNALSYARRLLEAGRAVGIFPEGMRRPGEAPHDARTGIAKLAYETGADILPAALYSPGRGTFGEPIALCFGKLIPNSTVDFGDGKSQGRRRATEQVMAEITRLWAQLKAEHEMKS